MGVSPVRFNQKCASDGPDARTTSKIGSVKQSLGTGGGFQPPSGLHLDRGSGFQLDRAAWLLP